jgi:DNA primase
MTDFRALVTEMAAELDHYQQLLMDDRRQRHPLADRARAALAEPEAEGPTDDELMADPLWLQLRNHPSLFCLHIHPSQAQVLLEELADRIEQRGDKQLDLDPGETAEWLRNEAAVAQVAAEERAAHEAAIRAR